MTTVTDLTTLPEGFAWEDPPAPMRPTGRTPLAVVLATQLDLLATRPGTWAKVRENKTNRGAYGSVEALRKQTTGYEFVARGTGVYGRFVGDDEGTGR